MYSVNNIISGTANFVLASGSFVLRKIAALTLTTAKVATGVFAAFYAYRVIYSYMYERNVRPYPVSPTSTTASNVAKATLTPQTSTPAPAQQTTPAPAPAPAQSAIQPRVYSQLTTETTPSDEICNEKAREAKKKRKSIIDCGTIQYIRNSTIIVNGVAYKAFMNLPKCFKKGASILILRDVKAQRGYRLLREQLTGTQIYVTPFLTSRR